MRLVEGPFSCKERSPTEIDALVRPEVVVMLERPDDLAELAEQLRRQAVLVQSAGAWARPPFGRSVDPEMDIPPRDMHVRLNDAIQEFTRAARAYLNTH
jgi:hypothetical protein